MNDETQASNQGLASEGSLLAQKMRENGRCRDDVDNLSSVTDTAALFLDTRMRIRGYTPLTARLLDLEASAPAASWPSWCRAFATTASSTMLSER